jgi:hypothetical protein
VLVQTAAEVTIHREVKTQLKGIRRLKGTDVQKNN